MEEGGSQRQAGARIGNGGARRDRVQVDARGQVQIGQLVSFEWRTKYRKERWRTNRLLKKNRWIYIVRRAA